jgi:hypothetical protein
MVYMARLARPVLNYPGNAPWQVVYVASVNGAKALQNLNKAGCSFLTEGRPCRKRAIRYETVSRWLAEGRINATEASVLRTSRRLCFWHAVQFLDAIYPGAKARIYRDNFKRQHRVTHQGLAVMQAMARAGLVKSPGGPHPGPRQCTARSKRTGKRCGQWRVPGFTVCRWHGAHRNRKTGDLPFEAHKAQKLDRTLAKMTERQRRREAGMLPSHAGFGKEPEPETQLEQQFRPAPRPRVKPVYEA